MEGYSALLRRAREKLPTVLVSTDRFQVPEPDVMVDGRTTVIRNFQEIATVLRREPEHVIGFLARELGCPGVLDLPRGVLKSKLAKEAIAQRLREYTDKYVICQECKRPDTHLSKEGRFTLLVCEACGAQRPVTVRRVVTSEKPRAVVVVGEVYRLTIEDVGRKGDGVAKKEGFVIFVTGATQRGSTVNAKITKVLGTNAYAVLQP
ncbi:MAG: translation initiation factor IF-2 subunit beta [Thermoplasmata archaeon]|nr:translation initiation factor IF-2 subunit beta [Thermoplasmata archaeon]MCI4338539.1 translation initiation factor IF-2 subunit beta [Thermoplasmata archaeon]MCI4341140.1 translation initiation factor IF-2 subunit beta [Thermoplasmata archaeon]